MAGDPSGDEPYVRRVLRALDRGRLGAVAGVTLLLSAEVLSSSQLLEFFSPGEVTVLWLEHFVELAVVAAALTLAYTLVDEAFSRQTARLRLAISCTVLFALSVMTTVLLYGYYAHGFEYLPSPGRVLADSLRFGLPAAFLAIVAEAHSRALQVDSAARASEISGKQLRDDEAEQQLALLQAQIEPHFLFNVLGNVRRLYRTQPNAGADAIRSLMRYLRAALPLMRTQRASLQGEIDVVRAYLDLLKVRMGARLDFVIDTDPSLDELEFPPMLLITLVENAVKHGIEPVGAGTVWVRAHCDRDVLQVDVVDDGAGLSGTASGGKGVGLANVRRQLAARYGRKARLLLRPTEPRGTTSSLSIPIRGVAGAIPGEWQERSA